MADRSELFVKRDSDGGLLPVEVAETASGPVMAEPLTFGDVQEYFGDVGGVAEADADVVARVFAAKIVDPDLSDITAAEVRDMKPMMPARILQGLMRESGIDASVDVDEDGHATMDLDAGN